MSENELIKISEDEIKAITADNYGMGLNIIVNRCCTVCGKKLSGNRLFVCEECGAKMEKIRQKNKEELHEYLFD